jgi:cell wall-associated NlpC family hydrolase
MLTRRAALLMPVALLVSAPVGTVILAGAILVLGGQCSSDGAGANPTTTATKSIPPALLSIYEEVGDEYDLPWQVLAGIGQEECDQGRDRDPSCTIEPGATGPGVANAAGASGPMQIGTGGAAGDEYDDLRHYLPNANLGPHDPRTAVELAALVLLKDKGAIPAQPIDSYANSVAAYNGSGPAAQEYAARVLADAQSYGNGVPAAGFGTCTTPQVALVPGDRAKILPDGEAEAPANAPPAVQAMIAAGNRINRFPYSWGGSHGAVARTMNQTNPDPAAYPGEQENGGPGYDCSSSTDYVLYGGGFGQALLGDQAPASGTLEGVGDPGPGRWVTFYASPAHAYIEVAGIYLDTAAGEGRPPNPPSTGPRWSPVGTGPGGFVARHPPGM